MSTTDVGSVIPALKPIFLCQKCFQPLQLDSSFNAVDEKILADLNVPAARATRNQGSTGTRDHVPPTDKLPEDGQPEALWKQNIGPSPGHSSVDSGNEFMLVEKGSSTNSHMGTLSHQFGITARLFDIITEQSDVDHPLCEECTDTLLDQLDQQLKMTEDECKEYRDFLEQMQERPSGDALAGLDEQLSRLRMQEQMLTEQLQMIDNERREIGAELVKVTEEEQQAKQEEERYYREYTECKRLQLEYDDEHRSVDNQLKYAQTQLDKLKKTNVFNATFHIWHNGHFGTINNFRLGRLPSVLVDWNEINAAWGQTVLLLHALSRKMDLTFLRYRLVPYGNHSYLECLADRSKELPLYGSGGFRFFWDTKFDSAMVAFLDCLQQFKEEVEKGDTGFCLPYRMDRGRVEDSGTGSAYSIKIQFNSEEQWTKALKFMLTNLKWGLAWVSSQFATK
ncbi:PREDICTED: beclin-1-like [Priapulus caudatus]|uniref:Beclin-1-like n=1 Tax=Priapulus caudatus TaxID=37621 RepID=A0ABM1EYQ3_PRICU|nr:PREDICTED: beclin-1-like [Priapulus caudatus]